MFSHILVDKMVSSLKQNPVASDVMSHTGYNVSFGLAVKIIPYPENMSVVWLMLGVKYPDSRAPAFKD